MPEPNRSRGRYVASVFPPILEFGGSSSLGSGWFLQPPIPSHEPGLRELRGPSFPPLPCSAARGSGPVERVKERNGCKVLPETGVEWSQRQNGP